jgi:hypothetical protein
MEALTSGDSDKTLQTLNQRGTMLRGHGCKDAADVRTELPCCRILKLAALPGNSHQHNAAVSGAFRPFQQLPGFEAVDRLGYSGSLEIHAPCQFTYADAAVRRKYIQGHKLGRA